MSSLLNELKRRNVFKVATAYVVVSWLTLQVFSTIAPLLELPDVIGKMILMVLFTGFPLALIIAWAFELTPDGIRRSSDVEAHASITHETSRKIDFIIIGALLLILSGVVFERLTLGTSSYGEGTTENYNISRHDASIAVLPFVNLSPEPEQEYFSDGISEEILNQLAQIPDLHVTSRSSSFQFKGDDIDLQTVATRLGVTHLLEGSVRKYGSRIRISAQLIETSTDKYLWSQTYNSEIADVFRVQDEISLSIVTALKEELGIKIAALKPSVTTKSVDAYDFYLRGLKLVSEGTGIEQYEIASTLLQQTIDLDPDFVPAYAGLCEAKMAAFTETSAPQHLKSAEAACEVAQSFDSERVEVKLAVSKLFLSHGDYDVARNIVEEVLREDPESYGAVALLAEILHQANEVDKAKDAYERAIALRPSYWRAYYEYGSFLFYQNQHQEALKQQKKALWLSPNNPKVLNGIGADEFALGNVKEAGEVFEQSLLFDKRSEAYKNFGAFYYYQHSFDKAAEMYEAAILKTPDDLWSWEGLYASLRFGGGDSDRAEYALSQAIHYATISYDINPNSSHTSIILGVFQTRSGNLKLGRRLADKALELDPTNPEILFFAALEAVETGQKQRSLELLRQAVTQGYAIYYIEAEPALDGLRDEEGYAALLSGAADGGSSSS